MKELNFEKVFEEIEKADDYWIEKAKLEFAVELEALLRKNRISYVELARRIGSSPPYITKVMGGTTNFTLQSMVKLARAAGGRFTLSIEKTPGVSVKRQPKGKPVWAAVADLSEFCSEPANEGTNWTGEKGREVLHEQASCAA